MKAIVATGYGTPDVLQISELAKPIPNDHEILVRVRAATVNAGDCRMRSFNVPPLFWLPGRLFLGVTKPRHPVLGMELAGEVEAVGRAVTRFKVGDQVFGLTGHSHFGAHAEYKCMPENGAVIAKPRALSYEDAATLSVGALTALYFLKAANIQPGHRVLVNGASGSVGTFAVQLAKYFGAEVTGVCSSKNIELVRSLGADRVIDYAQADFTKGGEIYDCIFDAVGTTTFAQCKGVLTAHGSYLHTVMVLAGPAEWWYARTTGKRVVGGESSFQADDLAFLGDLVESGRLKVVIDRRYPLEQVAEAHRYVDQGHKRGNVVIQVA